jgi:hypothetical protein
MTNQIKVLFLAANPDQTTRLHLDEEARAISEAIQYGRERDSLDFRTEWGVRTGDLQRIILQHQPQILHFSGHGGTSPGLMLGDERGDATTVGDAAIAAIVRAAAPPVRMVVLNACTSLPVIRRFRNAVDYTVGMDRRIRDASAIWFAAAFYGALAAGTTVEKAFEWALARLMTEGTDEAGTPRLLRRRSLRAPAVLISVPEPEPAPVPAPPQAPGPRHGTTVNATTVRDVNTVHGHATFYPSRER